MLRISPYLTIGLLALLGCIGAIVAYQFKREVADDLSPPTEKDLLDPLEKAYYSGLMREDEIQRIRESIEKQRLPMPKAELKLKRPIPKPKPLHDPEEWPELPPEDEE